VNGFANLVQRIATIINAISREDAQRVAKLDSTGKGACEIAVRIALVHANKAMAIALSVSLASLAPSATSGAIQLANLVSNNQEAERHCSKAISSRMAQPPQMSARTVQQMNQHFMKMVTANASRMPRVVPKTTSAIAMSQLVRELRKERHFLKSNHASNAA
jgi:hypothetical protein